MPTIIFIESDGTEHRVEAPVDHTVMEAARDAGVPGIAADCGGACACATCHVHIAPSWIARTGAPNGLEEGMLEDVEGLDESSRLSCQLRITADLDGLVCHIPAA